MDLKRTPFRTYCQALRKGSITLQRLMGAEFLFSLKELIYLIALRLRPIETLVSKPFTMSNF